MLQADDVKMLVDIGYMALARGFIRPADAIFAGVAAESPGHADVLIGNALALMLNGALDEAIVLLREADASDAVRACLGIALARKGDAAQAREILAEVAGTVADVPIGKLAAAALSALDGAAAGG